MFDIFPTFFANMLSIYYGWTSDYALSILMLTLTVMIFVLPLTLKATRSMIVLQKVTPELKKLQDKYKNDRQKLNEEMMAFYKDNKINPLSGCFPMLLQAPIFLFLYQALHGLIRRTDGQSDPRYLDHTSPLYQDLVAADGQMVSVGMNFAQRAISDSHPSIWAAIPFFLLILIMVFFQYWQQRQITSRANTDLDNPQAQMMRQIQKFLPLIFGVFALTIPAALVLYWAFQSVIRVFQQWAMYRFDPHLRDDIQHAKDDATAHLGKKKNNKKNTSEDAVIEAKATPARRPKTSNKSKRKGR